MGVNAHPLPAVESFPTWDWLSHKTDRGGIEIVSQGSKPRTPATPPRPPGAFIACLMYMSVHPSQCSLASLVFPIQCLFILFVICILFNGSIELN